MNAPMTKPLSISNPHTPFDHPEFDGHEQVVFANDTASSLQAIIAVHDTTLGPALGGCRMWPYANSGEALTDALRLSKGMSYKNALAGLPMGGGKAVVIADAKTQKTPEMLVALGRHIDRMAGSYITAEDVGMSDRDLEIISTQTAHAGGTKARGLGNPSPYTAQGVYMGLKAAARHKFGSSNLKGLRICVKGTGSVGATVARLAHAEGAKLWVADVYKPNLERMVNELGATQVETSEAHKADVDIFAPCALGADLTPKTIREIKASIISGAANNQLASPDDGEALHQRGILWAPDYVINAGGVISIGLAKPGDTDDTYVRQQVDAIGDTLTKIFDRAAKENQPTSLIADHMAMEIIAAGKDKKAMTDA
ncbi:Glu/Leu/Phe/Val dehydrogenase dimerization domain-containing protein [Flexibacterium corallicola]|uniref:Glu/Leu/Phe/Val dehydrogenase dimerization domain-containing protein n=1 Tax=Flexibacterium corallicola TaxID=3037259 RepID=UPI00286F9BF1|nr:Glu/Leu/Phe/Val dehydrogenase dimerization domain-containing protein [Pseudovibrio sp. M1P-2-3]